MSKQEDYDSHHSDKEPQPVSEHNDNPETEENLEPNIEEGSHKEDEIEDKPEDIQGEDIEEEPEPSNITYDRYDNQYHEQYESYFETNYGYLRDAENNYKESFKNMLDIEEVNVFFDLEMDKNIDDVGFYLNFNEFNAKEDPAKVKDLVQECTEILLSNQTNLDVDNKTVEQVILDII